MSQEWLLLERAVYYSWIGFSLCQVAVLTFFQILRDSMHSTKSFRVAMKCQALCEGLGINMLIRSLVSGDKTSGIWTVH